MVYKIDLRKQLKHLYSPSPKAVEIVDVPSLKVLAIDGTVEKGQTVETAPEFQNAFPALYGATYTLKFMSKLRKTDPIDYTIMPLEGLWWTDSGIFDPDAHEKMNWTLMIVQPDHITDEMYQEAVRQIKAKRGDNPALSKMRLESFREGLCVQMMHVGPYADERRTIDKMLSYAQENGYRISGKHHEIYMGDPRKAKPEKLKTILRYPIEKLMGS